jgi:hypothetical protein
VSHLAAIKTLRYFTLFLLTLIYGGRYVGGCGFLLCSWLSRHAQEGVTYQSFTGTMFVLDNPTTATCQAHGINFTSVFRVIYRFAIYLAAVSDALALISDRGASRVLYAGSNFPHNFVIDQDVFARRVVVPHLARNIPVIPVHLAGVGIPGDQAVGVGIVAGSIIRVVHRNTQNIWFVAMSQDPVTHTAPPPVCQALLWSFQVSAPGSPGAGKTYLRHTNRPVAASSPTIKSRTPWSPPAAPGTILSFTASSIQRYRHRESSVGEELLDTAQQGVTDRAVLDKGARSRDGDQSFQMVITIKVRSNVNHAIRDIERLFPWNWKSTRRNLLPDYCHTRALIGFNKVQSTGRRDPVN